MITFEQSWVLNEYAARETYTFLELSTIPFYLI